jgi:methyl-accepting chemotaxis protein
MLFFGNRKIYFIKKNFQSRFILRFVAIASVWAAAEIMLFAYLAAKRLDSIRYASHVDIQTVRELLLPITIGANVVSLLIFAGILAYTINALWKRLSPPLFTIKKDMARIACGDLMSEVSLSKKEEFQDLAADLDGMRKDLREKIVRIKEQQAVLSAAADELSKSILKGNPSLPHVVSLQSGVERMKEYVRAFHS